MMLTSLNLIALAFSTDFTWMVISCVIYGLGIGGITGLTVVVLVQSLGMEKLTAAFGLNVFIGGLVVFPGIIIIGKNLAKQKWIELLIKYFTPSYFFFNKSIRLHPGVDRQLPHLFPHRRWCLHLVLCDVGASSHDVETEKRQPSQLIKTFKE